MATTERMHDIVVFLQTRKNSITQLIGNRLPIEVNKLNTNAIEIKTAIYDVQNMANSMKNGLVDVKSMVVSQN